MPARAPAVLIPNTIIRTEHRFLRVRSVSVPSSQGERGTRAWPTVEKSRENASFRPRPRDRFPQAWPRGGSSHPQWSSWGQNRPATCGSVLFDTDPRTLTASPGKYIPARELSTLDHIASAPLNRCTGCSPCGGDGATINRPGVRSDRFMCVCWRPWTGARKAAVTRPIYPPVSRAYRPVLAFATARRWRAGSAGASGSFSPSASIRRFSSNAIRAGSRTCAPSCSVT